ncbi:release factor glutamine methyltransferase [Natranaerovirga hydrolytica]|uniref:Release factor glutamine methyltransferase n=1 Tax=Natranaerovirga hydrolytica TaxID=680378 RepID=A0A4R1MMB0_9FIRM|nr:peptide chain release factor N(5)-glutamine methyltransferase [Natranaerovirga hydrolytica]TCK92414.1 release factor glutamine methyltransferase [Natranaerovirga hydrolytica]
MEKTLLQTYYDGKNILEKHKIEIGKKEAMMLLEEVFNCSQIEVLTYPHQIVLQNQYKEYMDKINRRIKKEPIQYIIGKQSFMDLEFKVNPFVLIPRQDTETLVETVIEYTQHNKVNHVLDLCTGSGCIAISLGYYTNINEIMAIDISQEALEVAKENAILNQVTGIEFIKSDLFQELGTHQTVDMIVSNPPYIPSLVIEELMCDVKDYEPLLALDGKDDGLYFYKKIIKEGKQFLKKEGYIFFEIGYNQGKAVQECFELEGYDNIKIIKDLMGLDRIVCARKPI